MFLDYFNISMLKINLNKNKKIIILIYFQTKNTLKINFYYIFK
jgi:hypothetical protein